MAAKPSIKLEACRETSSPIHTIEAGRLLSVRDNLVEVGLAG